MQINNTFDRDAFWEPPFGGSPSMSYWEEIENMLKRLQLPFGPRMPWDLGERAGEFH